MMESFHYHNITIRVIVSRVSAVFLRVWREKDYWREMKRAFPEVIVSKNSILPTIPAPPTSSLLTEVQAAV